MGLFGKKEANHNGFLNRIANPNPNGKGLLGRIANPIDDPNGGLLDKLFNRGKRNQVNTTPTPTEEPTRLDQNNGGPNTSW